MAYKMVMIGTSVWYDTDEPFPEGEHLNTIIEELIDEGNYEIIDIVEE